MEPLKMVPERKKIALEPKKIAPEREKIAPEREKIAPERNRREEGVFAKMSPRVRFALLVTMT
jgi:hypothetical protein